ncbi:MAG: hypothetical protein LBD02_01570 [Christensenellaceae bacterium]|nr:hypothetical protein [Christensenellaceae bacterium]
MAWIELHQTLPTNKKTVRLKNLLRIKTPQAVGHLCILWLWALDNAPDGDLSGFSTEEIAEVACWTGKNHGDFVGALVQAGFIDSDMRLHDWYDYAGKLVDKRKQNAERMRRARATNVQRTDDERAGATVPYPTVPYQTVHNSTVPPNGGTPPIPPASGGSGAGKPPAEPQQSHFDEFWASYPKKVGKEAARKAWNRIKPDKALRERIAAAIATAKESQQWNRENGRFIPNPATWLNQGRWDDEYTPATPEPPRAGTASKPNTLGVLAQIIAEEEGAEHE